MNALGVAICIVIPFIAFSLAIWVFYKKNKDFL
jgi:hypothetical protein